ncbi:MAG: O-methyltransferase [Flavobacteriales bacterium]|jgi:predicted O-methyltransferase YrrM
MNFLPAEIEQYAEEHTRRGPDYLASLTRETWQKVVMPRMLSGHLQGRFLSMVSHMIRPRRILEIGTYTGYSALCLAEGLAPGGELITIDINDELQSIQDKYFAQSPHASAITRMFGDARQVLREVNLAFDLVFVDADKESYPEYYHYLMEHLPVGAFMLFDNVLWSGKVLSEPKPSDAETAALRELNAGISRDARVENVLLPLRDGLMLVRKLSH